jgi:hypothetical protein
MILVTIIVLNVEIQQTTDLSDTTVKADQNKVISFASDISDISDSTSSNIKMLADVTTDKQNHRASDISDTYDVTSNRQGDLKQNSPMIFRLGRSDTWACENCKQKGDVHYMREHLCRG